MAPASSITSLRQMDELADKIVEIIKDYRQDDGIEINRDHVKRWVHQFNGADQEFLLSELLHILPKSYVSTQDAIETLESVFEYLREKYGYETIAELISNSHFLNCQDAQKSQSILLKFLDETAQNKYGKSIFECGIEDAKKWIYFDDVLASGGVFRKDFKGKLDSFTSEKYIESSINTICIFFFLHSWGLANSKFIITKEYGKELTKTIDFHRCFPIDNNPRINYFNPNPDLNHIFPKESKEGVDFLNELEDKLDLTYEMSKEEFAFRPDDRPTTEEFYSSPENRDRYEQIVLSKGLEIFNQIEQLNAKGTRPLGFTPPSYKTLGAGSHAFTWRNISNTCPLVFWWEANDWLPLFSVQNRGQT